MLLKLPLLFLMSSPLQDPMSLERVLEAHRSYLERIHSLEAEIEGWKSVDGGANWTLTSRNRWRKDGPRERHSSWANGAYDVDGTFRPSELLFDYAYSPDETRSLQGWDWANPPSTPPSPANHYHMTSAILSGPTRTGSVSGIPPFLMMLAPTLDDYLPDAVRHGTATSLQRIEGDRGHRWEVSFETTHGVPAAIRVTLDPGRGYAPIRREIRTRGSKPAHSVAEVMEYQEVEPSLFIPTRIQHRTTSQPGILREVRVKGLSFNKPVSADALTFDFPEGIRVHDTRSGAFHIWGSNGPRQTFPSREEFLQYERTFFQRKPPSTPPWIYAGASLALAATLGWLMWLRRRLALRGPAA
ncbi:MAG: hypothetical protein KatS3mg108_3646 [Isosphaeraceae bacterium]|jgi:hypothetical protein|nr:MAG: hypothetical protein KatS3mg108_3646 [Isosphaeraceae bacterium]